MVYFLMVIPDIIYNLSLLVALCVFSIFLDEQVDSSRRSGKILQGVLFGVIAVVAMTFPYEYAEGIIFDGRTVVVSLGTLFFGPLAGGITLLFAALFRLYLGGDGMLMGILIIFFAFGVGWFFYHRYTRGAVRELSKRYFLMVGLVVHLFMFLTLLFLPEEHLFGILTTITVTVLVILPAITVLIGTILVEYHQRKRYLRDLEENEEKFRLLVESSDDIIFTMDHELRHTGVYGSGLTDFGKKPEDFIGKKAVEVLGEEVSALHEPRYREALAGEVVEYEWHIPGPVETVYFQTKLSPIRRENGDIIGLVGIGRNITTLKLTEKELSRSLREKEVLLSEIHHRVKNNMAIISSMLNLQLEQQEDPTVYKILVDTENRVQSMALLHEIVYERNNFAAIDMGELLNRLVRLVNGSYALEGQNIEMIVDSDTICLDMNRSIPFTLLVNELLTNAYKHAFRGREKGSVTIRVQQVNTERILQVHDDGCGVDDVDLLHRPESFGYTIVHGLVKQLQGSIDFESGEIGLTVTVRF